MNSAEQMLDAAVLAHWTAIEIARYCHADVISVLYAAQSEAVKTGETYHDVLRRWFAVWEAP